MSQQIRVLQCLECRLYQVDIVKKSNRWECKVCRQKQNVQREFFRGSGAECRAKVQLLNLEQGQKVQAQDERNILAVQQQNQDIDNSSSEQEAPNGVPQTKRIKTSSKWAEYIDVQPALVPSSKNRAHQPQLKEPKNTASSRQAPQNEFVPNKKPFSKWQNFL